ncbi:hypothetical protein TNCV_5071691 [Trichonephila clavipes]|nr:hypothetical protein TNCV_5071691 [Trichonephila clavipes]
MNALDEDETSKNSVSSRISRFFPCSTILYHLLACCLKGLRFRPADAVKSESSQVELMDMARNGFQKLFDDP